MHWRVEWAATVAQNVAVDVADTALLIEVCLDCLEHRIDGLEAKLGALLRTIDHDHGIYSLGSCHVPWRSSQRH